MGGPGHGHATAHAPRLIDIQGLGRLSLAHDPNAPLLIVFGGIPVDFHDKGGKPTVSGVYMWNYMTKIRDRFHIFVATSNDVNGTVAYNSLMKEIGDRKLTPSKQILYLFSGGYRPGMSVLRSKGSNGFSSIYLVDIWMGLGRHNDDPSVGNFYKTLADGNAAKLAYVYTSGGANNPDARDYIANKLGPAKAKLVVAGGHMATNITAVNMLP